MQAVQSTAMRSTKYLVGKPSPSLRLALTNSVTYAVLHHPPGSRRACESIPITDCHLHAPIVPLLSQDSAATRPRSRPSLESLEWALRLNPNDQSTPSYPPSTCFQLASVLLPPTLSDP